MDLAADNVDYDHGDLVRPLTKLFPESGDPYDDLFGDDPNVEAARSFAESNIEAIFDALQLPERLALLPESVRFELRKSLAYLTHDFLGEYFDNLFYVRRLESLGQDEEQELVGFHFE